MTVGEQSLHPTSTVQPDSTIRFRPESQGGAGAVVHVFFVLALLLAACIAALWLAKRKGWLDRWIPGVRTQAATAASLRLEQALRLSPRTTLFRIRDGEDVLLVVESTVAVQLVSKPVVSGAPRHG